MNLIKNRYTDEVIVEMEAENLKEVVEKNKANLRGADLYEANLYGARIKITQKEELLKTLNIIIE